MYVGVVNDELQGYERKWMNCNLEFTGLRSHKV